MELKDLLDKPLENAAESAVEEVVEEASETSETKLQRLYKELDEIQAGRLFTEIPLNDKYYEKRKEIHNFQHLSAQN